MFGSEQKKGWDHHIFGCVWLQIYGDGFVFVWEYFLRCCMNWSFQNGRSINPSFPNINNHPWISSPSLHPTPTHPVFTIILLLWSGCPSYDMSKLLDQLKSSHGLKPGKLRHQLRSPEPHHLTPTHPHRVNNSVVL